MKLSTTFSPTYNPLPRVLDETRLAALYQTELLDSDAEASFDRITALAARVLSVPVAIVSLVDRDRQFFKSAFGLEPPLSVCRQSPLSHSFCQYVVAAGKILRVSDAAQDPTFCTNGATTDWQVGAYLGVPLWSAAPNGRDATPQVLGAFAVIDHAPRNWSANDLSLLEDLAALVETEMRLRAVAKASDKQAQALRTALTAQEQSQAQFQGVTEASPMGIFVTDAKGACTYVNPKLAQITGSLTGSELLGNGLFRTLHPEDRDRVLRRWRAALHEGGDFSSIHRLARRDPTGRDVWISVKAAPMRGEKNEVEALHWGWAGSVEDISDRKSAEDALVETCRFAHQITDTVPLIMTVTDIRQNQNIYANREFVSALGYENTDENDDTFLKSTMHPDDLPLYLAHMERAAIQNLGELPLVCEYRMKHAEGHWCWFRSRDTVFERDSMTGEPTHILGIAEDISPAKEHEERLLTLTQQLQRSNASLQEFASVASHDLQEPLRKVQTFGNRLKTRCGSVLDAEGRDYLDRMLAASARMQTLIDDLLLYSRVSSKAQVFRPTDLNEIVRGVVGDLESRIEQTGGIVEIGKLPHLAADPLQMRQLMQNLIGNALKFHKPGTSPFVRVFAEAVPPGEGGKTSQQNGKFYRIIIQDNGIGFEEQYAERVFDVFERLHNRNQYEGTGMGLAICRKIVQRHGGTICAHSSPDQGTQFVIMLPVSPQQNPTIYHMNPPDLLDTDAEHAA